MPARTTSRRGRRRDQWVLDRCPWLSARVALPVGQDRARLLQQEPDHVFDGLPQVVAVHVVVAVASSARAGRAKDCLPTEELPEVLLRGADRGVGVLLHLVDDLVYEPTLV